MSKKIRKQDALDYHAQGRPGKIEVIPSKRSKTQRDLALAYSPGVAEPCLEIADHPEDVYKYTAKGNLVAVISNGTAVLGLGDIGPEASKPVMEGKGILFKVFADIDVFDIEVNSTDVDEFCKVVEALEPTFGGINLEDIKAPECFEIEERLKAKLNIPVMHDDQHGTAIISGAALLNALELVNKDIESVKIVVSGAGASALSCLKLFCQLGANPKNVVVIDSKGVIRKDRDGLSAQKKAFATDRDLHELDDALENADVFLGLSRGGVLQPEMLKTMAKDPIVFALANPTPEIDYDLAVKTRDDVIMATGRSDFPNQVNNVLGFPFIFRGALDVQSTEINDAMKLAAVQSLAALAKEPVPEIVNIAYGEKNFTFGKTYFIPKPLDPRLVTTVAPAVARAAMESGVAKKPITNWEAYKMELEKRLGNDDQLMRVITQRAKKNPKRVVFAEADNDQVLRAVQVVLDEELAQPILLGNRKKIERIVKDNLLDLEGVEIIDPRAEEMNDKVREYGQFYYEKRMRRGYSIHEAIKAMKSRNHFAAMMVERGDADAMISGLTRQYPDTIRPCLQIIGTMPGVTKVAGMYIMHTKRGPLFFADTTVNVNPTSEDLVQIAALTANAVRQFNMKPRIAFLSYSNFGSTEDENTIKIRRAVEMIKEKHPDLVAEGEMQVNFAFDQKLLNDQYPGSALQSGNANTLIFPNLSSGNIAYKMMQTIGDADAIGPILLGMKKPVHILQMGSSVREIVNMVAISCVDAEAKAAYIKRKQLVF